MAVFELNRTSDYYYGLLNSREKALYTTLLRAQLSVEQKVKLPTGVTVDMIKKTMEFISNDHPEIFWNSCGFRISSVDGVPESLLFSYTITKPEVDLIKHRIVNSAFYKQLDGLLAYKRTKFEKALAAYEYIIKHTDYDLTSSESNDESRYNINGVILNSKAVCEGYAKTFQYFMNKHDVYCTLVTGIAKGGSHAWNLVNLDGSFYYIDTTWGDPVFRNVTSAPSNYISYDFFCITTAELKKTHDPIIDHRMPLCYDTYYNYYRYFKMIADSFSVNDVASRLIQAYRKGMREVEIRYSSGSVYLTAKKELFEKKKVLDVLTVAKRTITTIDNTRSNYSTSDEKKIIKIMF